MEVRTAEDVEQIARSVLHQYGLFEVRILQVESASDGWEIVILKGTERHPQRLRVARAPAVRVRESIMRQLGVGL